ncbi:hypothetical protein DERF_011886 [Dermatophagoides farinae]|uniref:Uncharacterized protein n=1 Tax=Dermatophagoides farinae TaxID=6954 RepID=A0A922HRI1_DERFA|nr:uncharacterized protein LOC124497027 isoform X1 [Dermatophagoides farinae]KAH7637995.1 hypothetical protein HUG17_9099 [Dermatophagoides farinae]KAH9501014.1 hypothetical protein DERF_011886 [Dermatophagoides farinae]
MGQMMTKGLAMISEKTTMATKALKQPFRSSPFRRELREKCDEMTKHRKQTQIDGGERMPSTGSTATAKQPPQTQKSKNE